MASCQTKPSVKTEVISILDWPTETVSVDYVSSEGRDCKPEFPDKVLFFVPGNPGCIGWYIPSLVELVTRLGCGYAARGVSYAGHGINEEITDVEAWMNSRERDVSIPWTVNGQIQHKIAFIDMVCKELEEIKIRKQGKARSQPPQFILLSHSIGSHMVQRLCILRPDILARTVFVVHLMPFIRMKSYRFKQELLNAIASKPETWIGVTRRILQILKVMPYSWVDLVMKSIIDDKVGRDLAVGLVRQPCFAQNFLELGTEEVRDVPEEIDVSVVSTTWLPS